MRSERRPPTPMRSYKLKSYLRYYLALSRPLEIIFSPPRSYTNSKSLGISHQLPHTSGCHLRVSTPFSYTTSRQKCRKLYLLRKQSYLVIFHSQESYYKTGIQSESNRRSEKKIQHGSPKRVTVLLV